jgi:putative hydrolase of the HAD superfamily
MYGTTMAGLLHEHPEVDIDAYLDYVHAIDITRYLTPDPALAAMLAALPGTKIVFTNSIRDWAERVTVQLGIRQYFERIIDVRAVHYKSKPHPEAYAQVLDMLGVPGNACVLLDDQASYLRGAAAYGMRTVLIRTGSVVTEGFDFAVDHILDAGPILQRLLADNHGTKA